MSDRSFFATPSTYTLGKKMGIEAAGKEFLAQVNRPGSGSLPAARMIARLQMMGDVAMWHGWSTDLPKLRSRAAHAALASGLDQWVTLDDDVECDTATLQALCDMAGRDRIAVLPCLIRGTSAEASALNVVFESSLLVSSPGGVARQCRRGGTGLMVVGRGALQLLADGYRPELAWLDDDGAEKVALFEQRVSERQWFGEDYSFCNRARKLGIEILAPAAGISVHDGRKLDLASIEVRA